ncbi:CFEM domain-containing protein [Diaporthe helianthi]|uniref:CFEM domain-containing protein n=1 Tax=Diaporthe helianthi TaxID=158607 RepID=A0A2P5HQ80_DIAHE|nr:CFEM domain-containing protein [Diaporthe helianthi]
MADTGLQPLAIGISIAAPCVAFVFVLLRLYSRYLITRNLGWDDGLIVLPMILAIAQAYTTVMGIKVNFLGYHVKDIPLDQMDPVLGAKYNYATQLLYNPILALVKNGMLLFFLRVGGSIDKLRRFILAIIVLNTLMMVSIFLIDLLQCLPIEKTFYPNSPGTCINVGDFFIGTAAAAILTDILVMIIPVWITWNLKMKMRKKLAVIFLLSMGLFVYRMYYLIDAFYGGPDPDPTYGVGGTASSIEVNLAIASACGPFLKPLIVHYFPGFFGRESTNRYYEYYEDNRPDVMYRGNVANYSATASAAPSAPRSKPSRRLSSRRTDDDGKYDPEIELQSPSAKTSRSLRRGKSTVESALPEDGEDDSSQRRIVTNMDSMEIFPGREQEAENSGEGQCLKSGIMRETCVNISYSPKFSDEDLQNRKPTAPGSAF